MMNERLDSRVSVQDRTCSPEALLRENRSIDRKKAEAYSLGALFYYLLFKEWPLWSNVIKQADLITYSKSKKSRLFRTIQARYKKTIANASSAESIRNDLAFLTFKMLNPNPKKRIYLDKARRNIDEIAKKWRVE